jgi:hypothetical protein
MSKTYETYFKHKLATYVYSYCNMCNILIHFCNIHMQHLQHTSETLATYTCNMRFILSCCLRPTTGDDVPAGDDLHLVASRWWWHDACYGRDGQAWSGAAWWWMATLVRQIAAHEGRWPWRQGRVARRGVGWGHARRDSLGYDADWGEQMAARCGEARDMWAERGDIFVRDEETTQRVDRPVGLVAVVRRPVKERPGGRTPWSITDFLIYLNFYVRYAWLGSNYIYSLFNVTKGLWEVLQKEQ